MKNSALAELGVDVMVVVSFVAFGSENHDQPLDLAELLRVAAPFLVGLAAAWAIPILRRKPWHWLNGVLMGLVTTAIGLTLRTVVFSDGISGAFPVVAAAYIVLWMTALRAGVGFALRRM